MSRKVSGRGSRNGTRRRRGDRYRSLNVSKMVRLALAKEIMVVEGDRRRKITAYEAIVRQLSAKAAQSQRKPLRVLTQYIRLARKYSKAPGVTIVFEPPPTEPEPEPKKVDK